MASEEPPVTHVEALLCKSEKVFDWQGKYIKYCMESINVPLGTAQKETLEVDSTSWHFFEAKGIKDTAVLITSIEVATERPVRKFCIPHVLLRRKRIAGLTWRNAAEHSVHIQRLICEDKIPVHFMKESLAFMREKEDTAYTITITYRPILLHEMDASILTKSIWFPLQAVATPIARAAYIGLNLLWGTTSRLRIS